MKKFLPMLLALCMLLGVMSGCGSTDSSASSTNSAEQTVQSPEETSETTVTDSVQLPEEPAPKNKLPENYPMISEDGMTISIFQANNPNLAELITDYGELPWWQQLSERTALSFEWTMASYVSAEEQFNLLVAADDLPNLNMAGMYYEDGITNAIENDIFVDIAPYLDDYAPDYKKLTLRSDVKPVVYDETGSMIGFYEIAEEEFTPNNGVIIRGDLLEEQGLDIPVTYDEYEEVLTTLQKAYDIPSAIYLYPDNTRWISAGKNVQTDFSLGKNGEAIYGPVEDGFREYLKIMNRWYENGLIFKDFYAIPEAESIIYMISQMSSGESIVTFGYCEFAGMIQLTEGNLVAGYMPRDNKDDKVHLTEGIDPLVGVVKSCFIGANSTEDEVQAICMMINYLYTEEGALFANYGVQGESFEYDENGTPWFTDLIVNNPDGLTQTQALCFYLGYQIPAAADYTKYNISSLTTWADFVDAWSTADNALDMPEITLTVAEQEQYSAVATDVETYMDETIIKFIIGDMDPYDDTTWNDYVSTMERLGTTTMIEIYQAALDRFYAA